MAAKGFLDIDVVGARNASANVKDVGERGLDLRPALRRVRDMLTSGHKKQFASQGAYLGTPWAPLSSETVDRKGSSEVLVATGALRDSLAGGAQRKTSVTRSKVEVGTKVWYSVFAESGTKKGVPVRDIVGVSDGGIRAALWLIERFIGHGRML